MLHYRRQLEIKADQVEEALRRIGRLEGYALEPIVPALQEWRYRNKVEYSFGHDEGGRLVCGFHAPGRWDRIEPLDDCLLVSEAVDGVRRQVLDWCRARGLSAYDRRSGEGLLRNLVVREGRRTGRRQARLVTSAGNLAGEELAGAVDCDGMLWTRTDGVGETTAGGQTRLLSGEEYLEEELCGLRLRISSEAFFQTNTEMAERLYGVATDYAALQGWERVFDLFCGIGTAGP